MIADYLQRYINVLKWDIDQIVAVANKAQAAYDAKYGNNSLTPVTPTTFPIASPGSTPVTQSMATPAAMPQTTRPPSMPSVAQPTNADLFHNRHEPEFARCTVPLAMVLTSAVEFFGALLHTSDLWNNGNKFDTAIKKFFAYANVTPALTQNQVDLFRAIYRNGFMHGFFPQGAEVAINYDSSFEVNPNLFFKDKGDVVLNVNKLRQVVDAVFAKIINDTSVHQNISDRLTEYNTYVEGKTRALVDEFKAST
ncbi:hypothetical protein GCM10028808_10470 [Spirosoma migulaei]